MTGEGLLLKAWNVSCHWDLHQSFFSFNLEYTKMDQLLHNIARHIYKVEDIEDNISICEAIVWEKRKIDWSGWIADSIFISNEA